MDAAGQPHQQPHHRAADDAAEHGADGAGVGDGVLDSQAKVGAHDAEAGEDEVAEDLVGPAQGHLGQRHEQRRLGEQPGDHQIDAELLEERYHERELFESHGTLSRKGMLIQWTRSISKPRFALQAAGAGIARLRTDLPAP